MVQLELQPQPCQRDARCHCHRTPTCRWLGTRDECPCECCSAERGRLRALHVRRGGGYISGRGETGIRFAAPRSGSGRGAPPLAGDQCVRSDPCTRIRRATARRRPMRALRSVHANQRPSEIGSDRIGSGQSPGGGVATATRQPVGLARPHGIFCNPTTDTACAVQAVVGHALLWLAASRVPEAFYAVLLHSTWRSSKQDGRDREKIALSTGFKKISVRKM
ncbi:hypothetical protein PVAP13_9NG141600 [Panicum virgatum]|uniref:Uncharacterized protein n=1 Tax=Panicum virgatum TaxID=38727 RepID=A0A8T0MFW3_PANVG|nr:hypothetical protein PVAP13_9NG141600 [Panicum virgatum]